MAKKKDSGRKRERFGFQILTSELDPGNWLVRREGRLSVRGPGDRLG
jgi:hypothetical protein